MSLYKKEDPLFFDLSMKSIWSVQTKKPNQVILIQDGILTKKLEVVVKKWKEILGPHLTYLINSENIGLTKSLIKGIKQVNEKYIARMDSDDISLPTRFEKQFEFLEKNEDISVVGCYAQEINEFGNIGMVRIYPTDPKKVLLYICKATPLQHSGVMMRSSLFLNKEVSYNRRYRMTQDLALWFDLLCKGYKISNIPEILLQFRITKLTFARRNTTKAYHEFKIYMSGIFRLHFLTWRYIFPIARLVMRLLPKRMIQFFYGSSFRSKALNT